MLAGREREKKLHFTMKTLAYGRDICAHLCPDVHQETVII